MRTTIKIDSATPEQVYNMTLAFQRTRREGEPVSQQSDPTVTVVGSGMHWESPAMSRERAADVLREFDRMEAGLFDRDATMGEVHEQVVSRFRHGMTPEGSFTEAAQHGVPIRLDESLGQFDAEGSAYVEGEDDLDPASGDAPTRGPLLWSPPRSLQPAAKGHPDNGNDDLVPTPEALPVGTEVSYRGERGYFITSRATKDPNSVAIINKYEVTHTVPRSELTVVAPADVPAPECEVCGETLPGVGEDCPNYGNGPEHAPTPETSEQVEVKYTAIHTEDNPEFPWEVYSHVEVNGERVGDPTYIDHFLTQGDADRRVWLLTKNLPSEQ